jgi:soluble P-type ATPase
MVDEVDFGRGINDFPSLKETDIGEFVAATGKTGRHPRH